MDFSNSVILPSEDFVELQTAAWDQTPTSLGDRSATVVQTFLVCTILAGAVTAGSWGWAKAMDWREEKIAERMAANPEYKQPNRW